MHTQQKTSPELERRVRTLENEVKTLKATITEMNKRLTALEGVSVDNHPKY